MAFQGTTASQGIAFLIGAASVAEFIAKDVSSPQTVHLNAKKRAPTLMQWVHVGMAESLLFLIIAAAIDKKHAKAFVAGGVLEMVITEGLYLYARQLGMKEKNLPSTEEYDKRQEGGFVYG
jgi:hypothetical protein